MKRWMALARAERARPPPTEMRGNRRERLVCARGPLAMVLSLVLLSPSSLAMVVGEGGFIDVAVDRDAEGSIAAVSVAGDAQSAYCAGCVAASGTGSASGGIAAAPIGEARGLVAASILGGAHGTAAAASVAGDVRGAVHATLLGTGTCDHDLLRERTCVGVSVGTALEESHPGAFLPHTRISIQSDADFLQPMAISGVVSGSGTPEHPYVIAGWEIAVAPYLAGIEIRNTRAHVVVRDNHLHDALPVLPHVRDATGLLSPAIVVVGAENVTLDGNLIRGAVAPATQLVGLDTGIYAQDCRNLVIKDNIIHRIVLSAVIVWNCQHVRALGNTVTDARYGLEFVEMDDVVVASNRLRNVWAFVIGLYGVGWSVVRDNEVLFDAMEGYASIFSIGVAFGYVVEGDVIVKNTHHIDVVRNTIRGTCLGLYLGFHAEDNRLDGNLVEDVTCDAIFLYGHSKYTMERNWIVANTLRGNGGAIVLEGLASGRGTSYDAGTVIAGNNIAGNPEYGLKTLSSGIVDVRGNWWGDASGPGVLQEGEGDAILGDSGTTILFEPWLLRPNPGAPG